MSVRLLIDSFFVFRDKQLLFYLGVLVGAVTSSGLVEFYRGHPIKSETFSIAQ